MNSSKNENLMLQKLAQGIDSTSRLTSILLNEIRESEADFKSVKTELSILQENLKSLSDIVREGNSSTSLITQIALANQNLEDIEKWIKKHEKTHEAIRISYEDLEGRITEFSHQVREIEEDIQELKNSIKKRDKLKIAGFCVLLVVLLIIVFI